MEKANTSSGPAGFIPNPKLKLLDQVSEVMRFKHYSIRREVLHQEFGQLEGVERAKRPQGLPVVLTREEVQRVLAGMSGTHQ